MTEEEQYLREQLEVNIRSALSGAVDSIDAMAKRIEVVCRDFFEPGLEIEALPMNDEDRTNRVMRISLKQRWITFNIE